MIKGRSYLFASPQRKMQPALEEWKSFVYSAVTKTKKFGVLSASVHTVRIEQTVCSTTLVAAEYVAYHAGQVT